MTSLSRRRFLTRATLVGCSLAASPLLTPVSFAQAPWDTRLVVIILRGGMDGLDVVRPIGDPGFAALRHATLRDPGLDLDGFFQLHPALGGLMPMWQRGQLGFVHAVSTPYRDKRSHFDGQDLLEAGTSEDGVVARDGWLNRMLQQVPGVHADTAYAIGHSDMRLLNGAAPVANWAPDSDLRLSPQALRLAELVMESDPQMHAALAEAMSLSEGAQAAMMEGDASGRQTPHAEIAHYAADRLNKDARVAAFSLNGWDTHRGQANLLPRALKPLQETLLTLEKSMRPDAWQKTAVIAMTEFGRTARENGTRGTDHGTGGLMVMAGGAVRGGKVHGQWPGVTPDALYGGRDLMPTRDVRAHAAWIMRGLTGIDNATLERHVFPGLEMGADPQLLM
ncbi:twin-arginine translocation pathway signal [Sulfitobacter sp. SK012]|uniref:DUF1501 domain-containing protein n=1 Tax=Sulfitobacter sp. SK012 TaxID=1389005 RepID=UPI000E0A3DD1|nr:DUF1501 domain-containing protein [Sulfitobacter sp. SK012]AXI48165.1 twin-arginine translocation pathway signal [Sulfitobacter sp. SK012]